MSIIADLIRAGVDPELVARVSEAIGTSSPRREANRRAYLKRLNSATERLNSATELSAETTELSIQPRAPIRERVHDAQNLESKKESKKDRSSLRSDSSTTQNAPVDLLGQIEKIPKPKTTETIRMAGEGWNSVASTFRLPEIDSIKPGSTREKRTLARARDLKADYDLDAPEGFEKVFNFIRGSPYLRGEVNGFVCTFDWIVNPTNFTKIMEGNYEVRQHKNGAAFGQPKRNYG